MRFMNACQTDNNNNVNRFSPRISIFVYLIFLIFLNIQIKAETINGNLLINNGPLNLGKTYLTDIQLATETWSGSHGILFNAYHSAADGGIHAAGNTRYSNDIENYSSGAGAIMFLGNGGNMLFHISPTSTGKDTEIDWGVPKLSISRSGNVGINSFPPTKQLDIVSEVSHGPRRGIQASFHGDNNWGIGITLKKSRGTSTVPAAVKKDDYIGGISFSSYDGSSYYNTAGIGTMVDGNISENKIPTKLYFFTGDTGTVNPLKDGLTKMVIDSQGNVAIGTPNPGTYKLAVEGKIGAREVEVTTNSWADYVFEDNYQLKSLPETESYIKANKHLPGIPSEEEVKENGVNLGEMQAKLLAKIEELTLHLIQQNKKIEKQNREIEKQNKEISLLKDLLTKE